MNLKKFGLALMLMTTLQFFAVGQQFSQVIAGFSGKKLATISLENGTEFKCYIKNAKFKKGLIKELIVKDEKGKKMNLEPKDIKYMYAAPSGLGKLASGLDFATNAKNWGDDGMKNDLLKDGYVYYEKSEVMVKKKKITALLQLVNPSFGKKIRVYNDPWAGETASASVGGIKVAGGNEKSYYVKNGDEVAYRIKKKDYKKQNTVLFKKCKDVSKKYPKMKWADFAKHITEYTTSCN